MEYNTILPPFKWFILENFPYIEDDFDALTNWQLFCKLGKEMNKIIEKTNLTGEQVENLTNAFNSLKAYIDNYFENLDVQEEVNAKLDEMAESGELTDIIAQYLQLAGVLAYDTKALMKSAENLVAGSICKTLGNSAYTDGQGAFYRVRPVQNTDVIDDNMIIALHDPDLVAVKIPYSSGYEIEQQISNRIDMFDLNMQPNIIYDLATTSYNQGSCVIGNTLYVYVESDFPSGDIYKFNIVDGSYIGKVENKKLYHGNDMCAIGTNIYVASCKDDNGDPNNKKIVVFDTLTNDVTEINPFEDTDEDLIWGIAKYDDNTLICGLSDNGSGQETLEHTYFYLYDVSEDLVVPITITNTMEIPENFYYARQSMEYLSGKLYLMTSMNDCLLEFSLSNNIANVDKIYNLPFKDNNGQLCGEFEGLSKCDVYGKNALMITTSILDNVYDGQSFRTIKTYLVDPVSNNSFNSEIYPALPYITSNEERTFIYLKKTSTSLFENGSSTYPFKTFSRAIKGLDKVNCTDKNIIITDSSDYYIDKIYSNNIGINNFGFQCSPTLHIKRILDSKFVVTGENNTNYAISIYLESNLDGSNNVYDIANSVVKFRNTKVYVTNRTWASQSDLSYFGSTIYKTESFTSTSNHLFLYANHCIVHDSFDYSNVSSQSKWIRLVGDTVLYACGSSLVSNYSSKIEGTTNTITILPNTYH